MTCRFACAAATLVLLAACGGSDKAQTPGAMAGTYVTTAIQCGGGAGPPSLLALITPPNTWKDVSPDGHAVLDVISDGSCTISIPYRYGYPSAGTLSWTGAGVVSCSPSAGACATLLSAAGVGAAFCGSVAPSETATFTYTAIPAAAGGTMTLTAASGSPTTVCGAAGLTGPLVYTFTKE